MRARHWLAALATALFSCAQLTVPGPGVVGDLPQEMLEQAARAERALDSTVILLSPELAPICAGTFVGERRILTAAHCVHDAGSIGADVHYITRTQWKAKDLEPMLSKLIRLNDTADLALLECEKPSPVYVKLGTEPGLGEFVFAIGHPDLAYYTVSAGAVSVRNLNIEGGDYTAVLISIYYGSSGGGLFNDQWRLVGVASRMNFGGAIGYFASPGAVQEIAQ